MGGDKGDADVAGEMKRGRGGRKLQGDEQNGREVLKCNNSDE